MATRATGIPLSQVRPFYQVVIFLGRPDRPVDVADTATRAFAQRRRHAGTFEILRSERSEHLQYIHVRHSAPPAWVRGRTTLEDVEHDEVLLYTTERFMFLHSNCSALLELLTATLAQSFDFVSAADIDKVLAKRRPEIRSLGMQNLNAPGRSAPEGKTYFARDATYALSPARDAMYGFRHAFAVERGTGDRKAKPFGCSTTKRKVWGTWVEDANAFVTECDRLEEDLTGRDPGRRPWPLATPLVRPPSNVVPIAFYTDYTIHRKGTIWMEGEDGDFSADWSCHFVPPGGVRFEVAGQDGTATSFDLTLTHSGTAVALAYPSGAAARRVKLCDDSGELDHRRARDLVELLHAEQAFTVVFTRGVSFRSGSFWKLDGLDTPFTKCHTGLPWKGIDITKEILTKGRKDTVGDAILRFLKAEGWARLVICDDGANEVADYLAVGDRRLVLIHAKYSEEPTPGLRVGDVQVVLAQCLKNLQFFHWPVIEPLLPRLTTNVLSQFRPRDDPAEFLRNTYEDQRTERECWVVQPGISAASLERAPKNRIHSLLNHADAACLPGNIAFRFYCSP